MGTTPTSVEKKEEKKVVSADSMTSEEKAIFSRVSSENKEWETITEESANDFSLAEDPFKLPKPALELREKKKFAFRWIRRDPGRLDEVKNAQEVLRWWPVNGVQPVPGAFDGFVDSSTGAVHCLDQMLVFKPWWLYEREQAFHSRLATTKEDLEAKDGQEKNDIRFAASRRKLNSPGTRRTEISGSDIMFRGEAEADSESA